MAQWSLAWAANHWGAEVRDRLASCLLLEEVSRNTAASAAHTLPLLQARGVRAVGLVTDGLHLRRACWLFQRRFRRHGLTLHPLPARGLLRHYWDRRRYLGLAKLTLREGGAWIKLLGRLPWRDWG